MDMLYAGLSYEQTVRKYAQTIASVCVMHLKNHADAEDCFQNVFLKLYTKSPDFCDENHLKAWLIRVAINECSNMRRARKRTISLDTVNSRIEFPFDEKDMSWAFVQLEPKYRNVLYLRYVQQYNSAEIGQILGKNANTIRTMLKRGVDKLRAIYGGNDNE